MNIVILDGFAVNPGDMDWSEFEEYGTVKVYDATPKEMVIPRLREAEVVFTNRVQIDGAVLDAVPGIRLVCALGTGYDMIDTDACRKRGVQACNIPAYSSDTVAQFAMMHLLHLTTDFAGLTQIVKDGKWTGIPGFAYQKVKYTELAGKTIGLIGYGGIGRRMAQICLAFGLRVLATSRSHTSGSDGGVTFLPLEQMLPLCDYVSLHCPLNDHTRGMVDKQFLSQMKDGAILINTARGAILKENDVAEALASGKLGAAGLDVLAQEPASPDNPLLHAPNCVITPHAAWTAPEARRRIFTILKENLSAYQKNGIPAHSIL